MSSPRAMIPYVIHPRSRHTYYLKAVQSERCARLQNLRIFVRKLQLIKTAHYTLTVMISVLWSGSESIPILYSTVQYITTCTVLYT
jgi:hypothetical protein